MTKPTETQIDQAKRAQALGLWQDAEKQIYRSSMGYFFGEKSELEGNPDVSLVGPLPNPERANGCIDILCLLNSKYIEIKKINGCCFIITTVINKYNGSKHKYSTLIADETYDLNEQESTIDAALRLAEDENND